MAIERVQNIDQYYDYFEGMAKAAAFANFSFYKCDIDELINDLKSGFEPPGFWLEDYEVQMDDSNGNNYIDDKAGAFNLISPIGSGDFLTKRTILHTHEIWAKKFIGKMIQDREDGILQFLTKDFRRYKIVNFTSSKLCGVRVEFKIYDSTGPEIKFNEEDWLTEL